MLGAQAKKLFDVTLTDAPATGRVLQVSFYGKLPRHATIDKIVRQSPDSAISIDLTKNILAMAFLGDETRRAPVPRPSGCAILPLVYFQSLTW
jgi:hypothetical protein